VAAEDILGVRELATGHREASAAGKAITKVLQLADPLIQASWPTVISRVLRGVRVISDLNFS
jgi:hypothetical protein